jgi:hypothetical protein
MSVESLYIKIQEEAERQISELDAQFKDVRIQTNSFFDTLLKNIKDNNDASEKLKHTLPNDAFSTKIVDEIMASIKSRKDENSEITDALTTFMKSDIIPKEFIHRVKSIIQEAKKPMWWRILDMMRYLSTICYRSHGASRRCAALHETQRYSHQAVNTEYVIEDKAEEVKNDYDSRFSKAVGCTPYIAKSIESLYTNIYDESERKISELDAQFKDARIQKCSFFDNNEAVEKLKLTHSPKDAFSAGIMESIKTHKDENTKITDALITFMKTDLFPKEIAYRVKAKEPIGVNKYTIAEGANSTDCIEGVMAFNIDFDPFMSAYPDVYDHPEYTIPLSNKYTFVSHVDLTS